MNSAVHSALEVGILGAGQVGWKHARAFAQCAGVRVMGVADIDESRAAELARVYDAAGFTDYRRLLDQAPDIAVICLPHHLHVDAGIAAAEAGCDILMEKPLADTLEGARLVVDICKNCNVFLTVGFVHRFRTEFKQARRLISAGEIGTPAMAIDNLRSQGGSHTPQWVWREAEAGGGVLMYGGIHSIDRLRWLLDAEVEEARAWSATYSQHVDVEEGLIAVLGFAGGCRAVLFENAPRYVMTPGPWDTEVYGSRGRIRVRTRKYLEFTDDSQRYRLNVVRNDNFVAQAREFVSAVREGREPWITGDDGIEAVRAAEAIYRSVSEDRLVSLAEV